VNIRVVCHGSQHCDFIKLDTQGYELPILKGAGKYMDNVIGLEIEVEFEQMYIDQPLFNEVDAFVKEKGFSLFDIKRYYWKRKESQNSGTQKGQLIFGDALYFRNPEQILMMDNISQEKIIRAICIYLVYGYIDLAQVLLNKANSAGFVRKEVFKILSKVISKYCRRDLVPDSRLRRKLSALLQKLAIMIQKGNVSSGTDRAIGNL